MTKSDYNTEFHIRFAIRYLGIPLLSVLFVISYAIYEVFFK